MELFDDDYLNQVVKPVKNHFDECMDFASRFVIEASSPFCSEEIIEAYKTAGLPDVKESRVWGAVVKSLKKKGMIEFDSYGVYHGKQGHGKPINIWKRKN